MSAVRRRARLGYLRYKQTRRKILTRRIGLHFGTCKSLYSRFLRWDEVISRVVMDEQKSSTLENIEWIDNVYTVGLHDREQTSARKVGTFRTSISKNLQPLNVYVYVDT